MNSVRKVTPIPVVFVGDSKDRDSRTAITGNEGKVN